MATTLDEVMALADNYAWELRLGGPHGFEPAADARLALEYALRPIIADAQHYRSLQGKIDAPSGQG